MTSNDKSCNSAFKQLYYEAEAEASSKMVESSRQYSSDEYFKPEGTVTIPKHLWTQVQQCLHLMTREFSQLNRECDDEIDLQKLYNEMPSNLQHSFLTRSSVRQRLFNDDNTTQTTVPQGQLVEKLFVRRKVSNGPGVELASRQTFLPNTKSKISEIESLDSGFCQENSSAVGVSTQEEYSQPQPSHSSSKKKCRRRYRLVRRHSASCQTPGKRTSKTTSEHKFDTQENKHFARNELYTCQSTGTSENKHDRQESYHVARNEHSFDQCFSNTDNFHVSEQTKTTAINSQSECSSSPELYDVLLIEAPPTPCVHSKVDLPQVIPRNRTPLLTTSFQENCLSSTSCMHPQATSGNKTSQVIIESSQGHGCSSNPGKHPVVNVTNSCDPEAQLRRPLFQQCSETSAESMPSPIRCILNTNITETSGNSPLTSNAHHPTLSSSQNNKNTPPSPDSSKSPCAILQPEISVDFLRTKDILKRTSTSVRNEGNTEHNIQSGQNNASYTKSRRALCAMNRRLVSSPTTQINNAEGSLTTQSLPTQCERKSEVTTSEKLKGDDHHSNSFNSPSGNHRQLKTSTPRRAKFHPYATCNKSRTPLLISPFRDLTIRSPRQKWTTLHDRSPMAMHVKQARRISDPIVASRKILDLDDLNTDNEKIKAQDECGSNKMKSQSCLQYRKKLRVKQNDKTDSHMQYSESHSNCSTDKCTKTFCFNCSMDLS